MPSNFPTATTEASGQSQRSPHEQALLGRIGERIADEVEKVAHGRQTDCEQAASDVLVLSGRAELLEALKRISWGSPDDAPPFRAVNASQMQAWARAAIAKAEGAV